MQFFPNIFFLAPEPEKSVSVIARNPCPRRTEAILRENGETTRHRCGVPNKVLGNTAYAPCVVSVVPDVPGVFWCRTERAQTEPSRRKAQCQTILLHTSFKLRFNGHIITFPP